MKDLIKRQEEEFDKSFWMNHDGIRTHYLNKNNHKLFKQAEPKDIKDFISKIRTETAKYEREKIIELVGYSSFDMDGDRPVDRSCSVKEAMETLIKDIENLKY